MRKIKYELYSEGIKHSSKPLIYKYDKTSGIEMTVRKEGFSVVAERTVKTDPDGILSDRLFKDAIKKCCLIQLVKYGVICFKSLYVKIDGAESILYNHKDRLLIFGLCGNNLSTKMSSNWRKSQFSRILSTCKSKENRIDAALYALIMAKSKTYEAEKFIYLWMAMNGLYGHMAGIASEYMTSKREKNWIKNEYAQLKFMAMFYEQKYASIERKNADKFRIQMESAVAKLSSTKNNVAVEQNMQQLKKEVLAVLEEFSISEKMSPEATLLIYFPYLMRCKYFHSERALPLLCFEEEHPLPVIRVLNQVLEEFLDENLYKWMDEQMLTKELYPRIEKIAKSCECDGNNRLHSCEIDGKDIA